MRASPSDERELPGLAGREVRLEHETVEGAVAVLVHGLREHLVAGAPVGDGEPAEVGGGHPPGQGRRRHLDRFRLSSLVEGVRDPHEDLGPRAARGRGGEDDEDEGGGHSHRSFSGRGRRPEASWSDQLADARRVVASRGRALHV